MPRSRPRQHLAAWPVPLASLRCLAGVPCEAHLPTLSSAEPRLAQHPTQAGAPGRYLREVFMPPLRACLSCQGLQWPLPGQGYPQLESQMASPLQGGRGSECSRNRKLPVWPLARRRAGAAGSARGTMSSGRNVILVPTVAPGLAGLRRPGRSSQPGLGGSPCRFPSIG